MIRQSPWGSAGLVVGVLVVAAGCTGGGGDDSATTLEPPTTITTSARTPDSGVTTSTTSTTAVPEVAFTVDALDVSPSLALGSTQALGSGCSPGGNDVPDGVWFGWVSDAGPEQLDIDLACLWPGRLEPAASNDAARIRQVPVAPGATVYEGDAEPVGYRNWIVGSVVSPAHHAPGLPQTMPYWLFINDGVVTEIARYERPVAWARTATAWPELHAGCCDAGPVVPPSPGDPWPNEGWPVDGFYALSVERRSEVDYELTIQRWLSCGDNPGLCPDHWVGNEVTVDPGAPLIQRQLVFDEDLTVVLRPIFDDPILVGDGIAFKDLLADLNDAISQVDGDDDLTWPDQPQEAMDDPAHPFGPSMWPNTGELGPIGYRGPAGSYLTPPETWWTVLEITQAKPVLYIHAGMIAG
jgi:hypothetical protein